MGLKFKSNVVALSLLALLSGAQAALYRNADVLRGLLGAPAVRARTAQTRLAQAGAARASQPWSAAITGSASLNAVLDSADAPSTPLSLGFTVNRVSDLTSLSSRLSSTSVLEAAQVSEVRAGLAEARRRLLSWHALRLASAEVGATQAELEAAELTLTSVQSRSDAGAATPLQVDSARTALSTATWNIQQAATAFTQATADWNALFAGGELDAWSALPLPDHLTDDENAVGLNAGLRDLQRQLAQERLLSSPGVQLSGGLNNRTFGLSGGYSSDGSANLTGNVNIPLSGAASSAPTSVSLGLTGQVPIPLGANLTPALLSTQSAIDLALIDVRAQQRRLAVTAAGVAQGAVARVPVLQVSLDAAKHAMVIAHARYQGGLASRLDEKNAVAVELRAEKLLLTAQRDADLAALDAWDAALWLPGDLIP